MQDYFNDQIKPLNDALGFLLYETQEDRYEAEQAHKELLELQREDMQAEAELMQEEERYES